MALPDRLPSEVVEFVNETVDSIEQLELLLMLIESSDRWWDAVTAASELGVEPARAQRALEHFATRNLLAVNLANAVSYRFDPGSPSLAARAAAFAAAYRSNARALFRLVSGRPKRAVRDFADAFRIRRHDDR